ncbi:MAG: TolC family protein [Rhodothermales bacterium]|nr:TolC family protein [Rhodothermales bacterium]
MVPLLLAALIAGPGLVSGQDTVRVGLSDAIQRAVLTSPDIDMQRARVDFAEARSDQARRSRFLTDLQATSAHSLAPGLDNPNGTASDRLYLDPDLRNDWGDLAPFSRVDVDLLQPLWTWGQLSRTIDAAAAGVGLEEGGLAARQMEVAVRTGRLYYTVVLLDAMNSLTDEADEAVSRARREVEKLLNEGSPDVGDADLFQVQITEQEIRRRVVEVREQARTARSALRRQLMLGEGASLTVEDRFLEPLMLSLDSLDTYQNLALENRAELTQVSAGIAAREALVDVARSDFYPKLIWGVHGHYSGTTAERFRQRNPYVGDGFLSRSLETGLGMQLELNFGQTRAKVEQARANLDEAQFQGVAARELILLEVEEAFRKVRIRQAALAAAEESFRIAREWLQTEYVNFDLDLGDTDDLIKAVQAKLQLHAARHEAVFDLNMAILELHASTGLLEPLLAY